MPHLLDATLPPGWHEEREIAALARDRGARPSPALVTAADLAKAAFLHCPRCGSPCAGAMALDLGRAYPAWRLAVCPGCALYGDLRSLF